MKQNIKKRKAATIRITKETDDNRGEKRVLIYTYSPAVESS